MKEPNIRLAARVERSGFVLDVNLNVTNRVLGIVGPSGSGKSTLIGVAAGLIHPQSCELTFQGQSWASTERGWELPMQRRGVGLVPQEGLLFPHWDVQKNLACGRHRGTTADASAVRSMARELGVSELLARPVGSLSGGQRQRVALGRALLSGPKWLLLDEPLGALDYAGRRSLLPLLRSIVDSTQLPLWFVSHDFAEVMALCDEIITIEQGRVVARDKAESLAHAAAMGGTNEERYENLLRGNAEPMNGDLSVVALGPKSRVFAHSTSLKVGQFVFVSLYADDIMIALNRPVGISARNVLEAQITQLPTPTAPLMNVRLADGIDLKVQLAECTIRELGLREGASVFALFKANACRVWAG